MIQIPGHMMADLPLLLDSHEASIISNSIILGEFNHSFLQLEEIKIIIDMFI
jgi:hypothetical protein